MPVVTVRLLLKATVLPTVVLVIATLAALTVLLNVVPPEFVIVIVPMSVPTAPLTVTAPVLLIVKLEAAPPSVPVTDLTVIWPGPPLPKVRVTPSASVIAPSTTSLFGFSYRVLALKVMPRSAPKL